MAKECGKCRFKHVSHTCDKDYACYCPGACYDKSVDEYIKYHIRPSWCPLAGLPEKHGRLIDADVLIAKWKDILSADCISPMFALVVEGCIKDVEQAKVVVEAEGEK